MRNKILVFLFAALATGGNLQAQDSNRRVGRDSAEVAAMISQNAERTAKRLKLDGATKNEFVKLFTEYRTKQMQLRRQGGAKPGERVRDDEKKALTDEQAEEKFQRDLARDEQLLQLKKEYFQKLKDAGVPASKLITLMEERRPGGMQPNGGNRQRGFGGPRFGGPGFGGGMPLGSDM